MRQETGSRTGSSEQASSSPVPLAFEGRLEAGGALELVKTLQGARATGVLLLGGASPARVVFEEGEMVAAQSGDLEGLPALAHALRLHSGTFRFEAAGGRSQRALALRHFDHGPFAPAAAPADTFAARVLRAFKDRRARFLAPRPRRLLEIPRARESGR